ncbi:MAG: hypothetical protein H6R07_448 [Proteobacteria bacterium]|nr:hypothetical protein [Pseudomonadota bacterium]
MLCNFTILYKTRSGLEMKQNKLIGSVVIILAAAGCVTPPVTYTPPISGQFATLQIKTAQAPVQLAVETFENGLSCTGRRTLFAGKLQDAKLDKKIAADKPFTVRLQFNTSRSVCVVTSSFLPKVGESYQLRPLFDETVCSAVVINVTHLAEAEAEKTFVKRESRQLAYADAPWCAPMTRDEFYKAVEAKANGSLAKMKIEDFKDLLGK